ncbi:egtD [Cordylochernes scorpioides]|uniref:EgtD n=1 Tax=Cordylochernes scorpioides TaxID=51811 RepID=A0ABY6KJ97_9ARAC|nr:egtD [Cordylochernes scorpioides]
MVQCLTEGREDSHVQGQYLKEFTPETQYLGRLKGSRSQSLLKMLNFFHQCIININKTILLLNFILKVDRIGFIILYILFVIKMNHAIPLKNFRKQEYLLINLLSTPKLIKTHIPFEKLNYSKEAKYIYMAINPKDCAVS